MRRPQTRITSLLHLLGLLLGGIINLWAQKIPNYAAERKQLERQRLLLQQELEQTQNLLAQTRQARQKSLAELALLRREIALREKLLLSIQQELTLLEQDIHHLSVLHQALHRDLQRLWRNYLWTLYLIDKMQNQLSPWIWIFTAESFQQAYHRLLYLRAILRFREEQLRLIRRTQAHLQARSAALRQSREEKARLLALYAQQTASLEKSRQEKRNLFQALREKERFYKQRLAQSRKELEKIQKRIDELIRLEVEAQRKRDFTATEARLTGAFEQNKGLLPWPIESDKAVITSPFGTVEDESGGTVTNQGIYIATPPGTEVRVIFGGKVTAVTSLPLQGKVVIVQHGTYRSVYAGLEETYVQPGQQVSILTPIGRMPNSPSEPPQLYFLIYHGKTPQNPLQWIARR
jgi:septal ring factor EnvC (AmiA/AmiB activator)